MLTNSYPCWLYGSWLRTYSNRHAGSIILVWNNAFSVSVVSYWYGTMLLVFLWFDCHAGSIILVWNNAFSVSTPHLAFFNIVLLLSCPRALITVFAIVQTIASESQCIVPVAVHP